MPFTLAEPQPATLPDDFVLAAVANYQPLPDEQAYLVVLNSVRRKLLVDDRADIAAATAPAAAAQQAVRDARGGLWKKALAAPRTDATNFIGSCLAASAATAGAHVILGRYLAGRDDLARLLFVVSEKIDPVSNLATDLLVTVNNSLNSAPQDKQTLFVAIGTADTIIRTVCEAMDRDRWSWWRRRPDAAGPSRGQRLCDQYVRKLGGIGRIGLEGPHTALATLALDGLRKEFVFFEAGRIKNKYLERLGFVCGFAAALMFAGYFFVRLG